MAKTEYVECVLNQRLALMNEYNYGPYVVLFNPDKVDLDQNYYKWPQASHVHPDFTNLTIRDRISNCQSILIVMEDSTLDQGIQVIQVQQNRGWNLCELSWQAQGGLTHMISYPATLTTL